MAIITQGRSKLTKVCSVGVNSPNVIGIPRSDTFFSSGVVATSEDNPLTVRAPARHVVPSCSQICVGFLLNIINSQPAVRWSHYTIDDFWSVWRERRVSIVKLREIVVKSSELFPVRPVGSNTKHVTGSICAVLKPPPQTECDPCAIGSEGWLLTTGVSCSNAPCTDRGIVRFVGIEYNGVVGAINALLDNCWVSILLLRECHHFCSVVELRHHIHEAVFPFIIPGIQGFLVGTNMPL